MSSSRRIALAALLAGARLGGASPSRARAGEKIAVLVLATVREGRRAGRQPHRGDHRLRRPARRLRDRRQGGVSRAPRRRERAAAPRACLDDISCLGRAGRLARRAAHRRRQRRHARQAVPVQPEPRQRRRTAGSRAACSAWSRGASRISSGRSRRPRASCSGPASSPARSRSPPSPTARASRSTTPTSGITPLISADAARRQAQRPGRGRRSLPLDLAGRGAARAGAADPSSRPTTCRSGARWPAYAAYGAAIAGGRRRSLPAGFLGVLSQLQPNGRLAPGGGHDDLEQKRHFALAANVSFGAARRLRRRLALLLHPLPRRHLRTYRALRRSPVISPTAGLDAWTMGGSGYVRSEGVSGERYRIVTGAVKTSLVTPGIPRYSGSRSWHEPCDKEPHAQHRNLIVEAHPASRAAVRQSRPGRTAGRPGPRGAVKEPGAATSNRSIPSDAETEPSDAESEVEVGASAAAPDVAGLPIDAGPDHDSGAAPASAAAAGLEPTPTDYSTIGAYLHELRRYPLMTREEEHEVAVQFCEDGRAAPGGAPHHRQPAAGREDRAGVPARAPQHSRPDPGGEHRPHPRGAEVRSVPRA